MNHKPKFMDMCCRKEFFVAIGNFLLGFFVAWILWSATFSYVVSTVFGR